MSKAEPSYAVVEDGVVTNVVVVHNPEHATDQGWISIEGVDPVPDIGWSYDGTTWTAPKDTSNLR